MIISKQMMEDHQGTSLRMFDIEIWLQLAPILAFLCTFSLLLAMVPVSNLPKKAKLIAGCLLDLDYTIASSMNAVSFITLFYMIYFMIFKSIVSNNIKTNSLIVNTSELADGQNDILLTKRSVCINELVSPF